MTANYTVIDLLAAFCSTILFAPLLLPIGYVTGWFTNVLDFRATTPPWRVLSALALAAAICPTVAYWTMWLGGWPGTSVVFGGFLLGAGFLFAGGAEHELLGPWLASFKRVGSAAYVIALLWLVIVLLSLVDWQIGDRLYFNVSSFDHSLRTEFTHSITKTGVPPTNPLFHLGSAAPLRYHYFWFILCSMVERIGGGLLNGSQPDRFLNARHAMLGSVVWAGWALAATVPLFLRFFYQHVGAALKRRAAIGVLLFSVTGLDLLPTIFYYLRWHYLYPDMEWWNSPVCAWFSSVLWVPHQVIALVACLLGFLLVWQCEQRTTVPKLLFNCLLAGFCFATAVGTSVFVTLIFVAFFFVWMAICFWKGWRSYIPILVLSGLVAVVLLAPHLLHIAGKGGGGAFLRFQIRQFDPIDRILSDHHASRIARAVVRLALLPLNYALELGFFLLGGALYWWRVRRSRMLSVEDTAAAALLLTSAGVCTFFRSALVNNDLGVRGFLPAQFILLLWSADWLARWREDATTALQPSFSSAQSLAWARQLSWARPLARVSLAIGVAGTVYAVLLFRFYGFATDHGVSKSEFFPYGETGRRSYEFRRAYEQLRTMVPTTAIIQTNPSGRFNDFPFGLYALRQAASMNETCGAEFGGDPGVCQANYASIENIFGDDSRPSLADIAAVCQRFSIEAIVLRNTDGAWKDRDSWAWQMQPAIANEYVRVYLFPRARRVFAIE